MVGTRARTRNRLPQADAPAHGADDMTARHRSGANRVAERARARRPAGRRGPAAKPVPPGISCTYANLEHLDTCPWSAVGQMWVNVLQGVTMWGTTPRDSRSGVAGLLPLRHLGSTRTSYADSMHLGLSRHVRTHARRQAPAHGAVEVPQRARGARRAGASRRPLHLGVSGRDLRGDDAGRAGRAEPVLAPGARAQAG